ncbi:MAG: STAS domain-containing protein [Magnetococcales bacterium]|nr:STAS domain-containing protein [Magnetococcales bacterium]
MKIEKDKRGHVISPTEHFTFKEHKEFHSAYARIKKPTKYILDMKNVKYVDSSALGMIQLLGDHSSVKSKRDINIINAHENVKKFFTIFNFDKMYRIS